MGLRADERARNIPPALRGLGLARPPFGVLARLRRAGKATTYLRWLSSRPAGRFTAARNEGCHVHCATQAWESFADQTFSL